MSKVVTVQWICDRCGKQMPDEGWSRISWNQWARTAPIHFDDASYQPRTYVLCDECSKLWRDAIEAVMAGN